MNIKIEQRISDPLFERTKIKFIITYNGAIPSRDQIKQSLAIALASSPENLVLLSLKSFSGKRELVSTAHFYQDKKNILKYEKDYVLIRNGLLEKEKKQEKKKQQAPSK